MADSVVNVHEAKTRLSELLDRVKAGEEIVLAKYGKPFAKMVPYEVPRKRILGFVVGHVPKSFFKPLPEEELAAWR
jgi:prevent-host-death family protein